MQWARVVGWGDIVMHESAGRTKESKQGVATVRLAGLDSVMIPPVIDERGCSVVATRYLMFL